VQTEGIGSRGEAGMESRGSNAQSRSRGTSAHTYSTYSTQGFSAGGSSGEVGGTTPPESSRSREASHPTTSTPFSSLRVTVRSATAEMDNEGAEPGSPGNATEGANADVDIAKGADVAVAPKPKRRLVPPRRAAPPAASQRSNSNGALAARRPRCEPGVGSPEEDRESRRLRWINAYDAGVLRSHGSYSSSVYSGYTGYSEVPSSSAYTATSGTSLGRRG
jgi:hypothetical protein